MLFMDDPTLALKLMKLNRTDEANYVLTNGMDVLIRSSLTEYTKELVNAWASYRERHEPDFAEKTKGLGFRYVLESKFQKENGLQVIKF